MKPEDMKPEDMKQCNEVREAIDPGSTMRFTLKTKMVDDKGNLVEQKHEVDGKPLTILAHQGNMQVDIEDEDVMTIDAESTVQWAAKIGQPVWGTIIGSDIFLRRYRMVFGEGVVPPKVLATAPVDVRHVVGMMLMIGMALHEGKRPFLKLPETYLHPAHQAGLVDMIRDFQK